MNPSSWNGPVDEWNKRFRPPKIKFNELNYWGPPVRKFNELNYWGPPVGIINGLRWLYCFIRYQWSNSNGPVFIVKLWMLIADHFFGRIYSFNQNSICRNSNHSSVLSRKQNIGWFSHYSLNY